MLSDINQPLLTTWPRAQPGHIFRKASNLLDFRGSMHWKVLFDFLLLLVLFLLNPI